jgi:hypothetical protein
MQVPCPRPADVAIRFTRAEDLSTEEDLNLADHRHQNKKMQPDFNRWLVSVAGLLNF